MSPLYSAALRVPKLSETGLCFISWRRRKVMVWSNSSLKTKMRGQNVAEIVIKIGSTHSLKSEPHVQSSRLIQCRPREVRTQIASTECI